MKWGFPEKFPAPRAENRACSGPCSTLFSGRGPGNRQKRCLFSPGAQRRHEVASRRRVLVLVALSAILGLRHAPEPGRVPQLPVPPTYLGYTQCTEILIPRGRFVDPVSWLNANGWGTDQFSATYEHEILHQEQMRRFSSCERFYDWYNNNRVKAEAEAFCVSAQVYARENPAEITLDGAIWRYGRWLTNYDPNLSHSAAIKAIKGFCTED